MSFLVPVGLLILFVVSVYVRTFMKRSRLSRMSWDGLIARLEPVSVSGISIVALDYLQPRKGQIELGVNELWAMIGEDDGLRRMYANAEILIALAGYAERWNPLESVIVAERMRRDGVALRRAALRASLRWMPGYSDQRDPFNVQEAASAYYLMRQRLLALYETSHAGRYSRLVAAL